MQVFGLYEQLITQVLAAGLQGKRLYVGERALAPAQASAQLAQFLSRVLTFALESVSVPDPEPRARLSAQIQLANRLILWLQQQIEEDEDFFADNLIDTQGRMLTAL
jgi:hypothetical protein